MVGGGGGGGGGARVSIPAKTRKTIQTIKEITAGNYSEEEIHAMLLECNMNPDEATQRLLLQDPFLEVKKKRDKRKENLTNKDSVEPQWRSGGPGRGGRGGRVNFSSRHSSHDGAGSKNSFRKENSPKQVTDPSASTSQETKTKDNAVSRPSSEAGGLSPRAISGGKWRSRLSLSRSPMRCRVLPPRIVLLSRRRRRSSGLLWDGGGTRGEVGRRGFEVGSGGCGEGRRMGGGLTGESSKLSPLERRR